MNTNPKRFETVDRFVNMNKETRLKLFGYLLSKYPEITNGIIEFSEK